MRGMNTTYNVLLVVNIARKLFAYRVLLFHSLQMIFVLHSKEDRDLNGLDCLQFVFGVAIRHIF